MTKAEKLQLAAACKRQIRGALEDANQLEQNPPGDISPMVFMDLRHSLDQAMNSLETVRRYVASERQRKAVNL